MKTNYKFIIPKFKTKKGNIAEIKTIEKAVKKLKNTLEAYSMNGISFEKIFNDDTVKHNCLANDMYVYKFLAQDRSQLRLLYHFSRIDAENAEVEIITYYMKRNDTGAAYKKHFQEISLRYVG